MKKIYIYLLLTGFVLAITCSIIGAAKKNGIDGVGIDDIYLDETDHLIVVDTNQNVKNLGEIKNTTNFVYTEGIGDEWCYLVDPITITVGKCHQEVIAICRDTGTYIKAYMKVTLNKDYILYYYLTLSLSSISSTSYATSIVYGGNDVGRVKKTYQLSDIAGKSYSDSDIKKNLGPCTELSHKSDYTLYCGSGLAIHPKQWWIEKVGA